MVDSWNVVSNFSKENDQLTAADAGKAWKNDGQIWQ